MAATFFMMRASVKTSLVLSWLGAISSLSDGSHGIREEGGWGFGNCIYSRAKGCTSYSYDAGW